MMRIVDTSLLRNFLERSIAPVMKQQIGFSGQSPRTALHQHSLKSAEPRIVAELWQFVDIDMNVARNKKINVAVAIIVSPRRSRAESARSHAGFISHILKLALAQIVIERVASVAGNVDILQAVVVVIGHGHTHAPTLAC